MRVNVDQDMCIGCGMCAGMCPNVFHLNAEGKAEAYADGEPTVVHEVIESCPVAAIVEE